MNPFRFDWIVILALTLLALHPLLQSNLPDGSDVGIHYWRSFEWEQNWRGGDYLNLWGEHFYYGYGYPFFQYYGGGSYALATLLGWLPGVDDVWRIKGVWAIGIFLTTCGAYWFGRGRFGGLGAAVMAAAWVFAPSVIFGEPLARASMPAVLAMGFWACSLAGLDRVMQQQRFFTLAVLSVAALLWSHNITAMMGMGTLGGWLAWQSLVNREAAPYWRQGWLVMGLGLGLAMFFWLPFWFVRDQVVLERLYTVENLDFRAHFQSPSRLFSLVPPYDAKLIGQKSFYQVGLASAILALVGAVFLLGHLLHRRGSSVQREGIFWLVFGLVLLFFLTPQSLPAWETFSFLAFLQFPTRLLNALALPLAWLAGSLAWEKRPLLWAAALFLLLMQGFQATPWGWTHPEEYPTKATTADYFIYELTNNIPATTGTNEFLPQTVYIPPAPSEFLLTSLSQADLAMRVNPDEHPDLGLKPLRSTSIHYEIEIEAPEPRELEIFLFYFQGWRARLNGEAIPLRPIGIHGFMGVEVPAGVSHLELRYHASRWHYLGLGISGFSFLFLLGWPRRPQSIPTPPFEARGLFGLVVCCALFGGHFALQVGQVNNPNEAASLMQHSYQAQFGDQATLWGYDLNRPVKQLWQVALYWSFGPEVAEDLNLFVHVVDSEGQVIHQRDELNFGQITQYPYWQDDFYLRLPIQFWFDEPLKSGEYRIRVGFWRGDDPENASYIPTPDGDFVWLPQSVIIR